MKKTIFISGAITGIGLIAGALFKIMHWPGASALIQLGIAALSLIFLPLLFILKIKDGKNTREKIIVGLSVLIGILLCNATLFTLMHWPSGNGAIWLLAISISAFVLIPTYFFTGIRNPETKMNTIVTSIILLGATFLVSALIYSRPSRETLKMKMLNYYQVENLLTKLEAKQSADSNELKQEINATCKQIKALILRDNIGINSIPEDFLQKEILIQESSLGDKFNDEHEGGKLFSQLISSLKKYNSSAKEKIPLGAFEDENVFESISLFNNYNALNSLSQIQLFVVLN